MAKLCLNSRDELIVIDLEKVAYFQANGNYTQMFYISGQKQLLTVGLTKVEALLRAATPPGRPGIFLRLGRSQIINKMYIITISVPKQRLYLGDYENHLHTLSVPKPLLKALKDEVAGKYTKKEDKQTANKTENQSNS